MAERVAWMGRILTEKSLEALSTINTELQN
jgi:hypothetical protein